MGGSIDKSNKSSRKSSLLRRGKGREASREEGNTDYYYIHTEPAVATEAAAPPAARLSFRSSSHVHQKPRERRVGRTRKAEAQRK